jgi:hypothetical protein
VTCVRESRGSIIEMQCTCLCIGLSNMDVSFLKFYTVTCIDARKVPNLKSQFEIHIFLFSNCYNSWLGVSVTQPQNTESSRTFM